MIITKKTDKCKQRLNSAQHNYYKKAEKTGMVEYKIKKINRSTALQKPKHGESICNIRATTA